jgi:hypothetical protein
MKFVRLFCLVAFVASTAALGGVFSQPQRPGRVIGQSEAESLRGGGCTNAEDNVCGTEDGCTCMLQCVRDLGGTGDYNPCSTNGTRCTGTICQIYSGLGTCNGG